MPWAITNSGLGSYIVTFSDPDLAAAALPALADEPEVAISIRDHQFVPSEINVTAGQKIKIVVKNEGKMPSEFESVDFHREKVVPSGKEITLFVGPLNPGSYEFFDDFHPDTRGHLVAK